MSTVDILVGIVLFLILVVPAVALLAVVLTKGVIEIWRD